MNKKMITLIALIGSCFISHTRGATKTELELQMYKNADQIRQLEAQKQEIGKQIERIYDALIKKTGKRVTFKELSNIYTEGMRAGDEFGYPKKVLQAENVELITKSKNVSGKQKTQIELQIYKNFDQINKFQTQMQEIGKPIDRMYDTLIKKTGKKITLKELANIYKEGMRAGEFGYQIKKLQAENVELLKKK